MDLFEYLLVEVIPIPRIKLTEYIFSDNKNQSFYRMKISKTIL
jgi:hypothetical protein